MLHLFKRVYLALDETLDTAKNRVVLSRDFGHPLGHEYNSIGKLLAYDETVEGLIGSGKTYKNYLDFFEFLSTKHTELNSPVIIYADRHSFIKVGTNFFRAALPLASVKDVFKILSWYTVRQSLLSNSYDFEGTVQNQTRLRNKAGITEAEVAAEFFSGTTNAIDFYNFFNDNRADLSLEFIVATYSYNGKCAAELNEMVKGFCIKHAYGSATEARQHIVDQLATEKTKRVLNLADRPINEMIDVLKQADSTAMLFDDRIFSRDDSTINFDANWRKLTEADIAKLSKTVLKVFRDIVGWPSDLSPGNQLIWYGFFTGIEHINNPAVWAQYLDTIVDSLLFVTASEPNKVNGTLMSYILEARKNNRELLRPFVLNGCT